MDERLRGSTYDVARDVDDPSVMMASRGCCLDRPILDDAWLVMVGKILAKILALLAVYVLLISDGANALERLQVVELVYKSCDGKERERGGGKRELFANCFVVRRQHLAAGSPCRVTQTHADSRCRQIDSR